VLQILECGCRTAHVALVGVGKELKYILATENMKAGDIIKTSKFIPRIPVRANEGDAYPLGALPVGTIVHNVEKFPDCNKHFVHAAGCFATIQRKFDDRVVILMPNKREYALLEKCMATVGRLSNVEHSRTPIGSPNRSRELGNRPRSGLWQRKSGRHGRKIKKPPPMKLHGPPKTPEKPPLKLTINRVSKGGGTYLGATL
jgi:large subunit ribosomal protein L2